MTANIYPIIDHIALTVKDIVRSKEFYKSLFEGKLGGKVTDESERFLAITFANGFLFELWAEDTEFIGSKFNRYQVGLHHFGLRLDDKKNVDELYNWMLENNVKILDKPQYYPEYATGYYAFYWEDLNGIKMEFLAKE